MLSEFVEYGVFLLLGMVIGYNLKNKRAVAAASKTFEMVDEEVRQRLAVSENLNKSLLDDIKFLREKIERLNEKILGQLSNF